METCHAVAEISYSRTCFGFKPKHKPTVDVLDEAAAAARVQQVGGPPPPPESPTTTWRRGPQPGSPTIHTCRARLQQCCGSMLLPSRCS